MKMNLNLSLKKKTIFFFRILFFCILFYTGSDVANAAPIKILSDTLHAADGIISTINQLMGVGHVGTDIIVHSNSQENDGYGFTADPADALSTTTPRYDTTGTLVTSVAPYQLLTTSATGYSGDNFDQFNLYSSNDLAHNYAFSVDLGSKTLPPVFHFAPGLPSYGSGSGYGAEWTLDPAIFSTADLSYLNAVNAGMMAVVRFNHPAWNWLDVKAALRQTGTNWPTGFDKNTYGFGVVDYASATGFSDNQILLQPPATNVANAGISSQVTFTLYPFKQTRRVKEVLFQFASAPAFHGSEMTLSEITTLGGTKITEYSGTLAVQSAPIFTALTNAYFVWFTSDNAVDNSAHFSRIDTYSVLGPISQSEISFTSIFDFGSLAPANNTIFSSQIPTLNWADAVSRLGIAKYQLFIDGSLNKDNITGTSTTPTASLLSGKHIWYLKAFDNNGNSTTTPSVRTFYVIPGYAAGHTFYVDNLLGSDNNEGSQSQPFATIALAGTLAQAGDTVVIIKNADTPYRDTIANTNAGTQGSHVTFRGIDANHKPEIWGSNSVSNSWSVYSGDTYMRTMTIGSNKVNLVAVGNSTSTISIKTKGSSRTTLNQGEWFWLSPKIYYRLAPGEVIGSLLIEESTSGQRSPLIHLKDYTNLQDIVARFACGNGYEITSTGNILRGVEGYGALQTINLSGSSSVLVENSVFTGGTLNGLTVASLLNGEVYNSVFYGNATGANIDFTSSSGLIFQNNIFSGNTVSPITTVSAYPGAITMSHNMYDAAGDSGWNTIKGTNNFELTDPLFTSPGTKNFSLTSLSPGIDSGTAVSVLSTDAIGNQIYGTPDIGAYEYQPPYTFALNHIPTTGSTRLYSDGKYRITTASSTSATANFSVTPATGYFATTTQYMDITLNTWQTAGDMNKEWTATSTTGAFQTHATSTIFTIGDLAPNSYYTFKLDGTASTTAIVDNIQCTNGYCLSDGSGVVAFTYQGGYSTHVFDLIKDTIITSTPTIGTPTTLSASVIRWNFTDNTINEAGFRIYNNTGTIATSSARANLSYLDEIGLSPNTQYSGRYVTAYNGTGNSASSSVSTSIYTFAPTPTTLTATGSQTSASLAVDTFPNATSGQSGYYFSRVGANSGWIQTNTWADQNLSCGTSYFFSVKFRNVDAIETDPISTTVTTSACPGGAVSSSFVQQPTVNSTVVQKPTVKLTVVPTPAKTTTQISTPSVSSITLSPSSFPRVLRFPTNGSDVTILQKILNELGYTVSLTGIGSKGNESTFYGVKTQIAVQKFQCKEMNICKGNYLTTGYGRFGSATRAKLIEVFGRNH